MSPRASADFGWRPGDPERDARQALSALGRHLYKRGLVAGVAGNLSLRLGPNELLVTPRSRHKGFLLPSELVRVPLSGPSDDDERRATSELPMHLACYWASPSVHAVVHTHAPGLTGLGLLERDLGAFLPEVEAAVGPVRPVAFDPSGSQELAVRVGEEVGRDAAVLLLRGHGALSVGESLAEAVDRTELAELSARAVLLARG